MSDAGPGAPAPAAAEPAPTPAAPPTPPPPAEETHDALESLPDMDADVEKAKAVLQEVVDGEDDPDVFASEAEADDEAPVAKAAEKEEAKAEEAEKPEEKPKEEPPADHVEQIKQILANMSQEQREQLLGTADSAFAALTGKKRRMAQREGEHDQAVAKFEKVQAGFDELVDKAHKNPVEALEVLGWSVEDFIQYTESGQVPVERLQGALEKKMQDELKGMKEELATARHQTNVERWSQDVSRGIQAVPQHADQFPHLAKKLEQGKIDPTYVHQRVMKAQANYLKQNGEKLELPRALGYIEKELEQSFQMWRDEIPDPSQAGSVKSEAAPEVPKEPVLNNGMTSERRTPQSASPNYEEMDPAELKEAARKALFPDE